MAKRQRMDDDQILTILNSERLHALGDGDEISTDRERALDYVYARPDRGYVQSDLPPDKGLSQAVSSDVHDAVETVLPDLMEIFTGGDDVVAFEPQEEGDEEQAQQETDYLNHVFYRQNPGWLTLYTMFKDALISKLGIVKWWWETTEEWDEFVFEDKSPEEMIFLNRQLALGEMEIVSDDEEKPEPDPLTGLTSFRARRVKERSKASVAAVPPEDFFIDRNARSVSDAMMAGHKSRVRAQSLIEDGFDSDLVFELRAYVNPNTSEERARDLQKDTDTLTVASQGDETTRLVEIIEYHAWLDTDGDGKSECWKIITGNADTLILDKQQIAGIQFATLCPYPITHRVHGRSLADLLVDIQKIKTALLRLMLNHAYFSVNPRPYVDMSQVHQYTLSDLAENRPGRPVRGNGPAAVTHLPPPALGFDIFGAMEYVSTMAETRTGVVRNAQGLSPDTLHDTAKGAMELMAAAQRKTRMIARIFAETGVRDLFLGLHDLVVRHAREKETVRLRGKAWVEVDPNKWDRRKDLNIAVGLGSNTRLYDFQFWSSIVQMQQVAAEHGLADGKNFFNAAKKLLKAGGEKNAELYFTDPESKEGQEAQKNAQNQPSPELAKVQGELQLRQQEAQAQIQLEQQKVQYDWTLQQKRFEFETQLAIYKAQIEAGLAEQAAVTEARLEAMAMERKLDLEEFKAKSDSQVKHMSAAISAKSKTDEAKAKISNVRFGGNVG